MQREPSSPHAVPIGLREETPRTAPRRLRVLRNERVARHLRRITLGGPELSGFPRDSDGSHIKLFFRRPGQTELRLPELTPNGPVWPPPAERPLARTYTVSAYDEDRGELSIDFVTHEHPGPASAWAEQAKPGDDLGIAGPGGPNPLLRPADLYLLCGDLTALPAIAALSRMMPRTTRGHVLLEVPSPEDVVPLQVPEGVALRWLVRRADESSPLAREVEKLAFSPQGFAFVAGEGGAVVTIRDHLLNERGLSRRQLYATPYWRAAQTEEEYHQERHRVMDELEEEP